MNYFDYNVSLEYSRGTLEHFKVYILSSLKEKNY